MEQKYSWFRVIHGDNFYFDMVGKCIGRSAKTVILEFNLSEEMGGLQRVQFYKEQVEFYGLF